MAAVQADDQLLSRWRGMLRRRQLLHSVTCLHADAIT
jgi:hypothetical protein